MFYRHQYLTGEASHFQYYAQFASEYVKQVVEMVIGQDRISKSRDEHLNDIPLEIWDRIGRIILTSKLDAKMRSLGDYPTLAGLVCIAKNAAKQLDIRKN
jgi:hypothetical protein